jgi:O-antigen/teichoic acid export membrane protein
VGLIAFGLAAALARRLEPFAFRIDLAAWRTLIVMGLPIGGSRIALMAILRGDILLLSLLGSAQAVGLYAVPSRIFESVTGITIVFAALMMPRLTAAASTGDAGALRHHLKTGALAIATFSAGFIALCLAFAEQILVLVAGPEFAPAAPALMLIAVAAGAHALGQLFRFALTALGLQRYVLIIDLTALAFAIGVYLTLIPQFSYLGAAIATALVELLLCLTMTVVLTRTHAGTPVPVDVLKVIPAAAASFLVMRGLTDAALAWPLAMLAGGVAYFAVLLLLGVIPAGHLRNMLRRGSD